MKKKLLSFIPMAGLAAIALVSCGSDTRNSQTPYGSLDSTLDSTVATAGDYKMSKGLYYNRLRYSASTLVTNQIKNALYANEIKAIENLFKANSIDQLTEDTKKLLVPTKNDTKLFELTGNELVAPEYANLGDTTNYDVIKRNLMNKVNAALSSAIFSTQASDSIKKKTDYELEKAIKTYIVSQSRNGITVTASDLAYTFADNKNKFNIISFTNITSDALAPVVKSTLLSEAENLASMNAVHQIADEEYIKNYDAEEDDDLTKNTDYYIYKDKSIESTYEGSYKTFGTYHAIIIQFNSRKEAMDTLGRSTYDFTNLADATQAKEAYLDLYSKYYSYKTADEDDFKYVVNTVQDDLSKLSDGVKTLIQDTLEDDQYLTEPRNINNKYVMAFKYDTIYDVSSDSTEVEYSKLTEEQKKIYNTRCKYNTLITSANNYKDTNFKSMVYSRSNDEDESNDILIFDPLFEHKFYNSYSTDYVLIDKARFNKDLILKIGDFEYSVDKFYEEASKQYANEVLTNYFQLEYAYTFYNDYVDSDTHDENVKSLETAISEFESGKNSSYDKSIGLETYLLNSYGYTTKDDVVKYYYDAASCLTGYNSKKIFTDWVNKNDDGSYSYKSELETSGILYNLLSEGNKKYTDLFSINLDHFLINIDDDGDGSPDDPDEFIKDMSDSEKDAFYSSVVNLARALYEEATNDAYKDNSLYKILTFIKTQYEQGGDIKSNNVVVNGTVCTNWDQFKELNKYNFLLTVEQLASSGDITQDTVSNFVTPFADYVKGVFKTCVDNDIKDIGSNGKFYFYNTETKEGNVMTSSADITKDTLCKTVYGFHVLVLNSYEKAKGTDYTKNDDSTGVQASIQLLIKEDSDDSNNNIYVTLNSYNDKTTEISFNQFFIYYIQKANGVESSLSSNISTLMGSMFDNIISQYISSNFQKVLLLDKLAIKSDDATLQAAVTNERNYYANLVCDYAKNADDADNKSSIYYLWVFDKEGNPNTSTWVRPEK